MTASIPADFEKALAFAIHWETGGDMRDGGYTPGGRDPGGKTKWGISQQTYPHLDIAALTYHDARDIYIADYWLTSGRQRSCCDRMPWPLNAVHFDCTVNVGNWKITKTGEPLFHGRANMILQRALGVDDDGVIGPLTLAALRKDVPAELVKRALQQRDMYYATRDRWADEFRQGWYNRTNALRKLVFSLH